MFLSSQRETRPYSSSSVFWIKYLDSRVVGRAALGEEAEGGIKPHHVVALEAVLEGPNQERLVGVGIPPAGGGQTLTGRGDEGEITGRKYQLCNLKISIESTES